MISVQDATPDRWPDVEAVMATRGDPARCWCQYFRLRGAAWRESTRASNRAGLHSQVESDRPPGVLAYLDGAPVGWCRVAPRSAYPRLAASAVPSSVAASVGDADSIWAVVCFVVRVGQRRRGVAGPLLDAAVDLARRHGASIVEGYPVDPAARESVSSSELYHGPLQVFRRAGFAEVARPYPGRAVVRRTLDPP
jgi:GNAT superfamily N-acetyltransferase